MASNANLIITLALINFMYISFAFDTTPLQDFCVGTAQVGSCKDPANVTADDFYFSGLNMPGNTTLNSRFNASVNIVNANTLPGLNGLGMTFMRVDLGLNGFFPPHYHSKATELVTVLEGSLELGFITSHPEYKYYSKILNAGDVFVVPVGLVHIPRNVGNGTTVVMVAFNSQNPGTTNLPEAIFAAKPSVDSGYLAGAFQLDKATIESLQTTKFNSS